MFFEALWFKIIFFPFRLLNNILWWIYRAQLRLWRIKNVDRPYKKGLKAQKSRR